MEDGKQISALLAIWRVRRFACRLPSLPRSRSRIPSVPSRHRETGHRHIRLLVCVGASEILLQDCTPSLAHLAYVIDPSSFGSAARQREPTSCSSSQPSTEMLPSAPSMDDASKSRQSSDPTAAASALANTRSPRVRQKPTALYDPSAPPRPLRNLAMITRFRSKTATLVRPDLRHVPLHS